VIIFFNLLREVHFSNNSLLEWKNTQYFSFGISKVTSGFYSLDLYLKNIKHYCSHKYIFNCSNIYFYIVDHSKNLPVVLAILWYTKEVRASEQLTGVVAFNFCLLLASYNFFFHLLLTECLQASMASLLPIWDILFFIIFINLLFKLTHLVITFVKLIKLTTEESDWVQSFLMLDQISFIATIFINNDSKYLWERLWGWIIILRVEGKWSLSES